MAPIVQYNEIIFNILTQTNLGAKVRTSCIGRRVYLRCSVSSLRYAMPVAIADSDPNFATTLARGLAVLRAYTPAEEFLGNKDLALRTGLSRPTISRLARTLVNLGYLRQAGTRDKYSLGPGVLELAHPFLAHLTARRVARPLMQQLADSVKGAVSLGMRRGIDMVLVESCQNAQAVTARPDVGATRPVEATAMGNLLTQVRASGELGSLAEMREVVRASSEVQRFEPAAWESAADRFASLRGKA